jgi:hypothetical protein
MLELINNLMFKWFECHTNVGAVKQRRVEIYKMSQAYEYRTVYHLNMTLPELKMIWSNHGKVYIV